MVAEGEPDHGLGRVATALVDEFVAGGRAERVVDPGVQVGQGTQDVLRRQSLSGSIGAWGGPGLHPGDGGLPSKIVPS